MPGRLYSGVAGGRSPDRNYRGQPLGRVDVRELPGLFYLRIFIKVFVICLAIAVLLHALGLIGDPFVWMRAYLPFLMPKHH
jgi:hypothetical protein